jgi:uncharacterized repeat protein (TIGR01451 family)
VTLTNNGPSDVAAGVEITDTAPAGTTISSSDGRCVVASGTATCTTDAVLTSGASTSFSITLAVSAGYSSGSLSNTASISSSPVSDPTPGNNSATDTDTVTGSADLSIAKDDSVGSVAPGTSTTYTVTLTNNGPSDVAAGVEITDTAPAGTTISSSDGRCVVASGTATCTTDAVLTSGASTSFSITLAVSAGYSSGSLSNTASISSSPVSDPTPGNNSATDTDTVTAAPTPHLTLTKEVATSASGPWSSSASIAGPTTVYYRLVVTNDGNVTISGVTIADPLLGTLDCDRSQPADLAAGETMTCNGSHDVTQTELDAAPFTNTASASGTYGGETVDSNSASASVRAAQGPHLGLTKTVAESSFAAAGTVLHYTLTATNDGTVTLTGVSISDPALGTLSCAPPQPATLAPGESLVCTGAYTTTQADLDAGQVENVATATARDLNGDTVEAEASSVVHRTGTGTPPPTTTLGSRQAPTPNGPLAISLLAGLCGLFFVLDARERRRKER